MILQHNARDTPMVNHYPRFLPNVDSTDFPPPLFTTNLTFSAIPAPLPARASRHR